jgi:hypothetical protein
VILYHVAVAQAFLAAGYAVLAERSRHVADEELTLGAVLGEVHLHG